LISLLSFKTSMKMALLALPPDLIILDWRDLIHTYY
jgi:hypothetical protein